MSSEHWRCALCRVKNPSTAYICISCESPNQNAPEEVKREYEAQEKAKKEAKTKTTIQSTFTAVPSANFAFTPVTTSDTNASGFAFNPSTSSQAKSDGFAFVPATSSQAHSGGFAFIPIDKTIGESEKKEDLHAVKRHHDEANHNEEPDRQVKKLKAQAFECCGPHPTGLTFSPDIVKQKMADKGHKPTYGFAMTIGCGDMSQLGLGLNNREAVVPAPVQSLLGKNIVQVAAGSLHNLVLTKEGTVYSWGCNDDGALGRVTSSDMDEFLPGIVSGLDETITSIACGASHSLALSKSGKVYSWGAYRDASGLIGFNKEHKTIRESQEIKGFPTPVIKIAAGESHSLALTQNGQVYYWGDIFIGRRASARTKTSRLSPILVPINARKIRVHGHKNIAQNKDDLEIVDIFSGGYTSFALAKSGKVWVWGPNNYTQCGIERTDDEDTSIIVPSIIPYFAENNIRVVQCAAASHFSIVLAEDGRVFAFGRPADGRLGQPKSYIFKNTAEQTTPLEISSLNPTVLSSEKSWKGAGEGFSEQRHEYFRARHDDKVISIACGESHAFAVTQKGRLYGWGNGELNQLGFGKAEVVYDPVWIQTKHVTTIPRKILQASGGSQHSIILAKDISYKAE